MEELRGQKAEELLVRTTQELINQIDTEIKLYDQDNLIERLYSVIEGAQHHVRANLELVEKGFLSKEEHKLRFTNANAISVGFRYILERITTSNIPNGTQKITDKKLDGLIHLSCKLSDLSSTREYMRLSDLLDFRLLIDDNKNIKTEEMSHVFDKQFSIVSDNYKQIINDADSSTLDTFEKEINHTKEIYGRIREKDGFETLDNQFYKFFGFNLLDHILVLQAVKEIFEQPSAQDTTSMSNQIGIAVYNIKKPAAQCEIDFLKEYVKSLINLDENRIIKVIEFSTLNYQHGSNNIVPWKIDTRPERLAIKPLVKLKNGRIIFGWNNLTTAQTVIMIKLTCGLWPYSSEGLPGELLTALMIYQKAYSKRFEKDVYEEIKKFTPYLDYSVGQNKNDKCIVNIVERCPGELDVISIHKDKKKIILWEVKYILQEVGARNNVNNVLEFTKPAKGYISIAKSKEDFLKRHIQELLTFYGLEYNMDWNVLTYFVLPGDNIIKEILAKKYNIISKFEIEGFLKTL